MPTNSFFSIAFSLFLVMNAMGNVPLYVGLLNKIPVRKQRKIILRELLIALAVLLIFTFFGDELLRLLGISQAVIGIGGGILLFLIAISMIFPKPDTVQSRREEPFIVPLAMPLVAGPGSISAVMVYSEHAQNLMLVAGALVAAWIPATLILMLAPNIRDWLGEKGLTACARFGGMILTLISVQMLTQGIIRLVQDNFPHLTQ